MGRSLSLETCAELLVSARESGLARVERASRQLALDRFEALARTEGFLALPGDVLTALLADDTLRAEREERVFEALVRWIRAATPELAGAGRRLMLSEATGTSSETGSREEGLLRAIRFPLMDPEYLAEQVQLRAGREKEKEKEKEKELQQNIQAQKTPAYLVACWCVKSSPIPRRQRPLLVAIESPL